MVLAPRLFRLTGLANIAFCESPGLHLEVHFSVDVGRIDRDMSEPRTDRVNVNTGAQKMDSSCVPDRVRTYLFRIQ